MSLSTQCLPATFHSTTIQRIPKAITSTCCTSTLSRRPSPSPNMFRRTRGTCSAVSWYPTRRQEQICLKSRATAGLVSTAMSWASLAVARRVIRILRGLPCSRVTILCWQEAPRSGNQRAGVQQQCPQVECPSSLLLETRRRVPSETRREGPYKSNTSRQRTRQPVERPARLLRPRHPSLAVEQEHEEICLVRRKWRQARSLQ